MGFSFSKQELFIKITIFLVLFTRALHCSTFTKKSCWWPAGLQVFIFGHQSKHSSRQKLYIFIRKGQVLAHQAILGAHQLLSKKGIKVCASCVEIIWVSSTEIIWKLRIKAWQREVAVIKSYVFPAYPRRSSGDLYQRVAT